MLWHWPHFFQLQATPDASLPLHALLWPFYRFGAWGVDLFFCISGFVFFTQYAGVVARGALGAMAFARLRISRLYPLHLVTLLAVTGLQSAFVRLTGHAFVYPDLSATSFALQLGFASNWWTRPYSFNGPIWSVSVEVLLYAAFFVLARIGGLRPLVLLVVSVAGLFLMPFNEDVARGLAAFFVGCLCGIIVERTRSGRLAPGAAVALVIIAVLWSQTAIPRAELIVKWIAFPALVIGLSLADARLRPVTQRLHWLGDISYSSYLIHFPLQLVLVSVVAVTGATIDFSSPWTLASFFAILILLSLVSFHWLERPAMRWIRGSRTSIRSPAGYRPIP